MRRFGILSFLILMAACGKGIPDLADFDELVWKDDRLGCGGKRLEMSAALDREKEKLLALTEVEIASLLGKPDQTELYTRNQKFYYYQVAPADSCATKDSSSSRLVIRFNAMGLAKEVRIDRD